jgi:hypothetical protein
MSKKRSIAPFFEFFRTWEASSITPHPNAASVGKRPQVQTPPVISSIAIKLQQVRDKKWVSAYNSHFDSLS